MKLLSIIVPSYNMEKYLPKCLGSLVEGGEGEGRGLRSRSTVDGSYLDLLDVIVVNDGSKDRTSEIAHDFERRYPGVFRVIDKPNGHYGSCVNAAIPLAIGKYTHMLDADDYVVTERLGGYLSWLNGTDVDVAINDWEYVDEDDRASDHSGYSFLPAAGIFSPAKIPEDNCLLGVHALAYRTAILQEMRYRQTEGVAYSDQEWFTIPMTQVETIRYFPQKVFRYLYGRADQSVNIECAKRDMWMSGIVLTRLIKDYPKYISVGTSDGCDYYRRKVASLCCPFYADAIYADFPKDRNFDFVKFDELVRDNAQEIYYKVDAYRPSRRLPIRPVHEWRKHHSVKSIRLVVLKLYSKVARFIGRFM